MLTVPGVAESPVPGCEWPLLRVSPCTSPHTPGARSRSEAVCRLWSLHPAQQSRLASNPSPHPLVRSFGPSCGCPGRRRLHIPTCLPTSPFPNSSSAHLHGPAPDGALNGVEAKVGFRGWGCGHGGGRGALAPGCHHSSRGGAGVVTLRAVWAPAAHSQPLLFPITLGLAPKTRRLETEPRGG